MPPVVPRYDQQQVQQSALPNVRVNTEAPIEQFGGGRAVAGAFEAAQGLTNTAMRIAVDEQQKADDIALGSIVAEAKKRKIDMLHNPETGALAQRGQNAFGLPEQIGEGWGKASEELISKAPNDRVRAAAQKFLSNEGLDLNEKIQVHVGRERETYDSAVTQDLVQTSQNDALLNYNNPQRLGENLNLMRAAISKLGMRKGVPVDHIMADEESKVHAGVIERYLSNGQDISAKSYFDRNKEQLGQRVDDVEKMLEVGSLRGESQRTTDKLMSSYADLGSAREAVKDIKDSKLRDAVDERVQREFRLKDELNKINRDANFLDAYNIVSEKKTLDAVPPGVMMRLLPNQQEALKSILKRDPAQSDDPSVYLKYVSMQPGPLAKVTEAELVQNVRPYVTDSSFKEITRRWRDNRDGINGDAKAASRFKSVFTQDQMIQNALVSSKAIDVEKINKAKNGKDPDAAEALLNFKTAVDGEFKSYFDTHGKNPDQRTQQQIIDKLTVQKVYVDKVFRDPQKPAAALTNSEKENAYTPFSEIPVSEAGAISKQIRALNKEPSRKKIERAHAAYLMGDRKRFEQIIGE